MARELTSIERGDDGLTEAAPVARGADIRGQVIRVPVDSLQPNAVNGLLYRESLREDLLGALAESLRDDGQREPITVDAANVILDGERRWRALRIIGAQFADVIVDATPRTRDEVEDYVLDCYSLKRRASLYERVTIFEALVRSYTRRRGRPRGRPKKSDRNVADYWSPKRVRETAAHEAGLGSRETARRAQFVIRFGGDDIRARLEAETLSIDAAYRLLAEPAPKEAPPGAVEQAGVADDRVEPSVEGGQPRSSVRSEPRGARSTASDRVGQKVLVPESPRVWEPGETCEALPGWEVPEDGVVLLDAPGLEATDASPGVQLGAGDPSTAVDSDELDVGFDISTVELDDLLFAACGKIKVIARDPPEDLRELVERAAQMLFDAAGEAGSRNRE